jgi:FtsP/CotA-like multicopper oxidase with cupredoxin domain
VRVHLKNSLAVETTIHWHGMRVPAEMDGVPGALPAIGPGEEFSYEFTASDPGTFWYHPHVMSDEQVERGLYGAIVVRAGDEPEVTSEHVAVLDDVLLGSDDQLAAFSMMQAMVGRQGNVLLVNGHANPGLRLAPGGLHRFRFVNAATARYFRLSLGGSAFEVIGFDSGKLERPRRVTELLLVPGARADVLVAAPSASALTWRTLSYDRGHATGAAEGGALFRADLMGDAAEPLAVPDAFEPFEPVSDVTRTRTLVLGENMAMSGGHTGHGSGTMGPTFSINDKVFPDGEYFSASIGETEEWELRNDTEMDHPFHLHGFRFQVTSENGKAPPFLAYFDTINIRARQTTTIRIPFEANPGMWMFHCHILEHAERGMMGTLEVSEP